MAKFPQPYFRTQRGTWCVQIGGKQITLGPDQDDAFRLYHKLMANGHSPVPRAVVGVSVVSVLDLFLEWCQRNRARRTFDWYRDYLQSFVKTIPGLTVADLKPFLSNSGWTPSRVGRQASVGPSSRCNAL